MVKPIKKSGWQLKRVIGSHHVFTQLQKPAIVVVPHPNRDLENGFVKAMHQQAGVSKTTMRYPVAIKPETKKQAFGVVVPDLHGCFSVANTLDTVMTRAEEAITA